jgi:signal transduction histidine kinase
VATTPSTLRRLCQPLNLSAYVTWLAILVTLIDTSAYARISGEREWAIALMGAFLLSFVAVELLEDRIDWRRYTLVAVQALLALFLCVIWRNNFAAPVLTIIVMVQFALILSAPMLIAATLMLDGALWYILDQVWGVDRSWVVLFIYAGFQIFAAITAWYSRRAQEAAAALQLTNAHLLATRSLLEESARDQERLRLARELHDVAGHKLTALKLNLALLQRDGAPEMRPAVDVVARLATELLEDVRGVVAQLRQHDGMDVRQALTQLATSLPRPTLHLDLQDGARVENVAQAEALVRAAQEALTNVARHANASNAWIRLHRDGGAIRLHVHDDGGGASVLREGNGLRGMRERVGALGGSVEVSRTAAGGVALDVVLPLT